MSSSDRVRAAPAPHADAADPYANWLDRMQRARGRHAAITKNLHTWSSYKTWTEKVKGSWSEQGEDAKK